MRICHDTLTNKGCGSINANWRKQCEHCSLPLDRALIIHDPGEKIRHYRILNVIGYGRFGAVYAAEAIADKSVQIALKETIHNTSLRTFQREFVALRDLEHANLCGYYGTFVERDRGYLVMELIPGQSLQDILLRQPEVVPGQRTPLPQALVIDQYARQLCAVLDYLHSRERPVLHRDIKPANIRITPDGVIKLVDFGLLKLVGEETHPDISGIGTIPYAPPEQHGGGGQRTDQRSDVYSLCATLYHLLTGVAPLPAIERLTHKPDPLVPIQQLNPAVAPHIARAIIKGMHLSRRMRFESIQELYHELF
ncbi:MAG: serine/threonine protein kinase [Chloroflexaceae bacterium]|nr:serine/threonine protein kinase [Chloroflexaceae bacterium]